MPKRDLEGRFEEFFEALWQEKEWSPFSWQIELVERVNRSGWPEGIDLPTGAGKTACIEIALFTLACQAHWQAAMRSAPRRILFVIDRRVVVDQVIDRAREIRDRLNDSEAGVVREVAERLKSLTGGHGPPVTVHQMRGGLPRDLDWVADPAQPAIIASTVDQTGSRLLFRPYGSRVESAPVHAGLVGNDSLILLDEAHCSVPFLQTARAVARYRMWGAAPVPSPFSFVVLSATLPDEIEGEARYVPDLSSLDQRAADRLLKKRLHALKPTRLVVAAGAKGKRALEKLAEVVADEARELAKDRRAVGIMVNRIRTAQLVYDRLRQSSDADTILLTGRMRSLDRDDLLAEHAERFRASADRKPLSRVTFFVATQCLEVGADLDFAGLVTECSSLDSLRQRFGRLDRLGTREGAQGVVVIQEGQVASSEGDPVYGSALSETWKWLSGISDAGTIDMGIDSLNGRLEALRREEPSRWQELQAPARRAPTLLPGHVDRWVQTSPVPVPDPEPALFLHGVERSAPEVFLGWRADLKEDDADSWPEIVALCSPTAPELMPAPLWAVRQWLADGVPTIENALSDLEGVELGKDDTHGKSNRQVLVWRRREDAKVSSDPMEIRGGDILLIPVSSGGWDHFGHLYPSATNPISIDRGDEAYQKSRRRALLRLHPGLSDLPENSALRILAEAVSRKELEPDDVAEAVAEAWEQVRSAREPREIPQWLRNAVETLLQDTRRRRLVVSHPGGGWVLSSRVRLVDAETEEIPSADEDDIIGSSTALEPVCLEGHLAEVSRRAVRIARALGCSEELVADIALAGRAHDLGKAEPRFQVLLHRGDAFRAAASPLLAKSASVPYTLPEYIRARDRAHLPPGFRHEALSMRLFENTAELASQARDLDLVRYLISAHHGRCRPFLPVFDDTVDVDETIDGVQVVFRGRLNMASLDSGVGDRFWRLVRRFGWWGLALVEAVLRTADWQVSAEQDTKGGCSG